MSFRIASAVLVLAALLSLGVPQTAPAVTLIDNPFITSYENWVDPNMPGSASPSVFGDWRIHLANETLMETSDLTNGSPTATNTGTYIPSLLIQDGFTTPGTYNFTTRLYSVDDDGFGVVFGRQANGDYFRVFLRQQTNGNLGGTTGLSVQKVIGGVITQLNGPGITAVPTLTMIDNHQPIDVTVAVDGPNYSVSVAGVNGGAPLAMGSDAALMPGKVGIQSWGQRNRLTTSRWWGTEVESVSVSDNTGTLYSGNFTNMPVEWRELYMANSAGLRTNSAATANGDDIGHFGADFRNGWIYDRTNGFEWATQTKPNVDFLGPAVVVDDPGATNLSDYQMRVRMGAVDNDGIGLLVRVQDDDNFYRIHFANETMTATNAWERAPQGLSVQKVRNGVWTELFRDDQLGPPMFIYNDSGAAADTPGNGLPVFDVDVTMIGNQMYVTVIADPDGAATVISYPVIIDAVDPLLTGSVGFTKWGNEYTYFLPYGGQPGPLLTEVPEPSTVALVILATVGMFSMRRRLAKA
jgi:hypothetical protein